MFFTSLLVPSAVSPAGRTETFASTRRLPFSMSQSEIPAYSSTCLRVSRYARASWATGSRARDDLDERHAAAVQVDGRLFREAVVQRLPRILLDVQALDGGGGDPALR